MLLLVSGVFKLYIFCMNFTNDFYLLYYLNIFVFCLSGNIRYQ
mgnify:CR=1 FL=1